MIFLQAVAEHAQVQGIYRHKVQVGFSRMAGGNFVDVVWPSCRCVCPFTVDFLISAFFDELVWWLIGEQEITSLAVCVRACVCVVRFGPNGIRLKRRAVRCHHQAGRGRREGDSSVCICCAPFVFLYGSFCFVYFIKPLSVQTPNAFGSRFTRHLIRQAIFVRATAMHNGVKFSSVPSSKNACTSG